MDKAVVIEQLRSLFTRLAVTEHGVGVVAIQLIPKGTDPFVNCKETENYIELTPDDLDNLPGAVKQFVIDFCPLQDGAYQLPDYPLAQIDMAYYLNHSKSPNMYSVEDGFVSMRDIQPGEELTVDYDTYNDNGL